jgi:hypothetical protein
MGFFRESEFYKKLKFSKIKKSLIFSKNSKIFKSIKLKNPKNENLKIVKFLPKIIKNA